MARDPRDAVSQGRDHGACTARAWQHDTAGDRFGARDLHGAARQARGPEGRGQLAGSPGVRPHDRA